MSYLQKFFLALLFLSFAAYFYLQSVDYEYSGFEVQTALSPIIALAFFLFFKQKKTYFSLFILCFGFSDFLNFFYNWTPFFVQYYVRNNLFALAYIFLFIEIFKALNIKKILKEFKVHLLVLMGLSTYLVYTFISIELVDDTDSFLKITLVDYFLDVIYDGSLSLILSASLINHLDRYDKKSLHLFLGCMFLVFMEVLAVAYLNVIQNDLFILAWFLFTLIAFFFLLSQCNLEYNDDELQFNDNLCE